MEGFSCRWCKGQALKRLDIKIIKPCKFICIHCGRRADNWNQEVMVMHKKALFEQGLLIEFEDKAHGKGQSRVPSHKAHSKDKNSKKSAYKKPKSKPK